jgi:hypothetical protein
MTRAIPFALVAAMLLPSCTKRLYDGPVRAANETAALSMHGTRLLKVDARLAESGAKTVTILPGTHAVSVYLADTPPSGAAGRRYSREPLAACFDAQAAGAYWVRPVYGPGNDWWPEVLESSSGRVVSSRVVDSTRSDCAPSVAPVIAPVTAAAKSPTASTSDVASDPPPSPPVPIPPQPTRPFSRVRIDRGQVAGAAERSNVGMRFITGVTIGGERLASVTFTNGESEDLRAGDGIHLAFGLNWTPIWLDNWVGLGAGLDGGLKYASIGASNGHISLLSWPVILSLHTMLAGGTNWSLLARAGLEKDFAPRMSGDGLGAGADASLSSKVGFMGELGPTFTRPGAAGYGFVARFSSIEYTFAGVAIPAWNAGGMLWISYDFGPT